MWRIEESISGSYTGRIAPPGSPNMTSVPSISRLLMRAWAPVSCILVSACLRAGGSWAKARTRAQKTPRLGEGSRRTGAGVRRALGDYENAGWTAHHFHIVADHRRLLQAVHDGGDAKVT